MIFDLHNDLPTANITKKDKLNYYKQNNDTTIINAFWTTSLLNPLDYINSYIDNFGCKLYSIEDGHFITSDNISRIIALPIVYIGLVWNKDNKLCGGAYGDKNMSKYGKFIAKQLAMSHITLDTAHMSRQSINDLVDIDCKIINSHTCLDSIYKHPRNITNFQIEKIIERGGLVGLTMCGAFMSDNISAVTSMNYIEQIDVFAQKYGVQNLSISTDYFGTDIVSGLETYDKVNLVRYELIKLGYSNTDIDNIFFNNANKFFGDEYGKRKKLIREPVN